MKVIKNFEVNESLLVIFHVMTILYDAYYFNIPKSLEKEFKNLLNDISDIVDNGYPKNDILEDTLVRSIIFEEK